jgi:hypothetical protein
LVVEDDRPSTEELEPREPTLEDLVDLCRELNQRGARYVVVGGFAVRAAGYVRQTMDIDLLVDADPDNEARIYAALSTLPDNAARELRPGEIEQYTVIRVADEIVVDLMKTASGMDYCAAAEHVDVHHVQGVAIPFASPRLLWRMKAGSRREKDLPDLLFLREYFAARGEDLPEL